jgi:hypothetical protein
MSLLNRKFTTLLGAVLMSQLVSVGNGRPAKMKAEGDDAKESRSRVPSYLGSLLDFMIGRPESGEAAGKT